MTTYYHGSRNGKCKIQTGLCLTSNLDVAAHYAGKGVVYQIDVDEDGLTIESKEEDVDRDEQRWPGDTRKQLEQYEAEGLDVVTYDDETDQGKQHDCFRLVSQKAVDACTIDGVVKLEDDDE